MNSLSPIRRPGRWLLAIALLVGAIYAPSLANGFAMDDRMVAAPDLYGVRPNQTVHHLQPLAHYFRTNYHHGTGHSTELYRPLTVLSYAAVNHLQQQVDPDWQPFPHHVLNVLLHVLCSLLVFALVRRLTPAAAAPALAAALVFGVHALHSEVVAGVVGRAEMLAFAWGALGCSSLAAALRARGPRVALAVSATAVSWFLAFCSKESALAWLGFAPLYLWACSASGPAVTRGRVWALPAVAGMPVAMTFLWLRAQMIAALPGPVLAVDDLVNPLAHVDAVTRVCTATTIWAYGLCKTVLPIELLADYGAATFPLIDGPFDLRFGASAVLLLGVAVAGWRWGRRQPLILLAVAAFFGFGLLTSNVLFAIGTIFGERLYYTPSIGLALIVAWAVHRFGGAGQWLRRWPARCVAAAWLALASALVLYNNPKWRSDDDLFLHEVAHNPRSVRMLLCAARVHELRQDLAAAEYLLRRAVGLMPECALAWNNLGAVMLARGELEQSGAALRRGLRARFGPSRDDESMLRANLERLDRLRHPAAGARPR